MEVSCLLLPLALFAALPSEGHPPADGQQVGTQVLDWMELELKFHSFMKQYGKVYKDKEEEARRFKTFAENMEKARKLQEEDRGSAQYGVTEFSDLSEEEFRSGSIQPVSDTSCEDVSVQSNGKKPPETKDWRRENKVTGVRNQGNTCRACWAFAVVSTVESQWAIKTQELRVLSTQELLDCSGAGNCTSGYIDQALESVVKNGLVTDKNYAYRGNVGHCHTNRTQSVVKIRRCISLKQGDESQMKQYVFTNGTITTLVDLTPLQQYKSGILRCNHSNNPTFHAMVIAGYGVEGNQPYWIVKNSWGPNWGEEGYVRIYRGENTCGIAQYPMSAEV